MRSQLLKGASRANIELDRTSRAAAGVLIAGTLSVFLWAGIVGVAQIVF